MTVPIQMITCKVVTSSWLQSDPHDALSRNGHHNLAWLVLAVELPGERHILHTVYTHVLPAALPTDPIVRTGI